MITKLELLQHLISLGIKTKNNKIAKKDIKKVLAGTTTPWGVADSAYKLMPGLIWYGTPGHGGLFVSKPLADKNLSANAKKHAIKYGGGYWYEEDCGYAIPMYEHPEWSKLLAAKTGSKEQSKEELKNTIERWTPDYFKDTETEIIDFKDLKVGDKLYFDREDSQPYVVKDLVDKSKITISRDGGNFRCSKTVYFNRIVKVERDGKVMVK